MANDNVNQELLQIFIEEAIDLVNALSSTLREWENDLNNLEKIANLKRDLHTLKGSARMVGQTSIGTLAHEIETVCEAIVKEQIKIDRQLFDLICLSQDRISLMLESLQKNQPQSEVEDIIQKFHQYLPKADEVLKTQVVPPPKKEEPKEAQESGDKTIHSHAPEVIRVSSDLLESLNTLSIENSMLRSNFEEKVLTYSAYLQEIKAGTQRLEDQIEVLNSEIESMAIDRERLVALEQIGVSLKETATDLFGALKSLTSAQSVTESLLINYTRISTALQYHLSNTRLVPFESIVPRLSRITRQISSELHKDIDFKVTRTEGEMDRKVLEHIVPSLEHILRNAIDHGIESIEERCKNGKPERGKIEISFTRKGSIVAIEIKDDGGGIDAIAVRRKAENLGLLAPSAVVSDEEIIRFILEPGFSTREMVSEISGRGVGMDVVNMAVKEMGGSLSILSERGIGTRMIVRFPFTISLNRILLFKIQGQTYGILLANIENVVNISGTSLVEPVFKYLEKTYQKFYLGSLIDPEKEVACVQKKKNFPVILFSTVDYFLALVVDEILYNKELVIQGLTGQLKLNDLCSGATVLGTGEVVFILDPYHLTMKAKALKTQEKLPIEFSQYTIKKDTDEQTIMVVDDSVSARMVTKDLLERHHYKVTNAKDGAEALQVLESKIPDLILLDIDMPRMDGFEFSIAIKQDERFKHIPIIIITSRPTEHRSRAEELKLYNIIEKPYQETKLLSDIWAILGKSHER